MPNSRWNPLTYYSLAKEKWGLFKERLQETRRRTVDTKNNLVKRKKDFLTIMLVPHDHGKNHKITITYKSIMVFVLIVAIVASISSVIVLSYTGKEHEIQDLQISSGDFRKQSVKLKNELNSLHEIITYYYKKISSLYIRLGGNPNRVLNEDKSKLVIGAFDDVQTDIIPETYSLKSDIYYLKESVSLMVEIAKTIKQRKSIIKNTPSLWPVRGYILFPYGKYFSPLTGKEVFNNGIDIGTFPGTEVVATAPGFVYDVGYTENTGYYVKIVHKYGWKTIYSQMERLQIKQNQKVSKGEVIGYVGKISGNSIFHLHYEVHVGTNPLNPYSFLNQVQN